MRNALARFDCESEFFRHLGSPIAEDVLSGQSVERVVDLDSRKLAGVESEPAAVLEVVRVKGTLPFLECVATRSSKNFHDLLKEFSEARTCARLWDLSNIITISADQE
jgi:hypothetical protein